MSVSTSLNNIRMKVNIISRVEFELAHSDITVRYFNHYVTGTIQLLFDFCDIYFPFIGNIIIIIVIIIPIKITIIILLLLLSHTSFNRWTPSEVRVTVGLLKSPRLFWVCFTDLKNTVVCFLSLILIFFLFFPPSSWEQFPS